MRLLATISLLIFVLARAISPALGWVYPEHREITQLAVAGLDPAHRAMFDALWREARTGGEQRLCAAGADDTLALKPACIDWAALSAIGGDHSCSSADMLDVVMTSGWILDVAGIGAQLKIDLADIPVEVPVEQAPQGENLVADVQRRVASETARAKRLNALRAADNRLLRADPAYVSRATGNNAHFLLPRPSVDTDVTTYAELTLRPGSEISALGVYASYHLSALQKASRLANEQLAPEQRDALARAVLADEAFALHFLEDIYAAGHVAGTWGDASQRKGTHDYYNEFGLEVFTWNRQATSIVLMGDAHIRPQDADLAAQAVRVSLEQVLDVANAVAGGESFPHTGAAPAVADSFDVCRSDRMPQREAGMTAPDEVRPFLEEALLPTAVPSLGPGLGAMPRFRSEVGPFAGVAASIDGRYISGGYLPSQSGGGMGGLDLSVRVGLGLDGVMDDAGDGLFYVQVGFRADSPSTTKVSGSTLAQQGGNLSAAIPARFGLATRYRMPFYLVPGDLLILSPMYFIAPETYRGMAVTAGNGGLIPWQLGLATPIGRLQFVLGRELGVNFYGFGGDDRLIVPGPDSELLEYSSTIFDVPVLEYRPYRSFSTNQSSTLLLQLTTGADVPHARKVVEPAGAAVPNVDAIWYVGLRFAFDWRYYF